MTTFNLEIVATDKIFYQGSCESLVFPALDGEHGILAKHESMVSALKAGELRYTVDGEERAAAVGDGFIEVLPDRDRKTSISNVPSERKSARRNGSA